MSSQATRIESLKTGMVAYVIAKQGAGLEWEIVKEESLIELTKKESLLAKAKGFNLEKFLAVKQLLLTKKSYAEIKDKTGIAKTTISNYKKYYCEETLILIKEA